MEVDMKRLVRVWWVPLLVTTPLLAQEPGSTGGVERPEVMLPPAPPPGVTPLPPVMPPPPPVMPPVMPPPPQPLPKIVIARELMITDLSVVEDKVLTDGRSTPPGPWSFRALMEGIAGPRDASQLVLDWLRTWERDQVVNGFRVPARPQMRTLVTQPWLQRSGGKKLDLALAPFRLLAIVNRIDLRGGSAYAPSNAGEGRFVFGVLGPAGEVLSFTVILEYGLPARDARELQGWAESWHALGQVPFGARYNRLLSLLTQRFTRRGAGAGKVNGSALNQLRTNEIAVGSPWELREFVLEKGTGRLAPATVKQTPDDGLNQSAALADLINQNQAAILAGQFVVPTKLLGGASPVNGVWNAAGIKSPQARHLLALNTCSGCHQAETATGFVHVGPRAAGQAAPLSGFLTGTTVSDPVNGKQRRFADLRRRADDLAALLAGPGVIGPGVADPVAAAAAPGAGGLTTAARVH